MQGDGTGRIEEVGANRWFLLQHDDQGYALWSAGGDDDAPVARYPDSEEGFDDAWGRFERGTRVARRARAAGLLARLTVGAGIAWMLAALVTTILYTYAVTTQHEGLVGSAMWVAAIETSARVIFTVSLIVYVVLWMEVRRIRD